jgi:outer membrane autotransporter protein
MNRHAQQRWKAPANSLTQGTSRCASTFPRPRWLVACLLATLAPSAFANCVLQSNGTTVICDSSAPNPFTSSINATVVGTGSLTIPTNGATVTVNSGAILSPTGAAIQVINNSTVMVSAGGTITTTFINAYGMWAGDPNNASSTTAGYGNTLENDGTIRTNGSNSVGIFARTSNRTTGNTLINRGKIDTYGSISGTSTRASSAGIRSESVVASTILNYGTVAAHGAYATIGTGSTMAIAGNGVEMAGPGSFTNEAGASVTSDNAYGFYANGPNANGITVVNAGTLSGNRGAVLFGPGQSNNTVMLEAGSTTTGSIDAGSGGSNNTLVFDGFTSTAFANAIPNWQLVALRNGANVTLSASSYALTNLLLDANTTATFNGPALTISGQITDNGSLVFASPSNLSIAALIRGSGSMTQAGSGTLVLTGPGSYTGPTTVASGTLQAGAAYVLSPYSAYTVNGGATLDLGNASQSIASLAGAGSVTLGVGTLTTGTFGTSTLFSGVISGSGGLVKAGDNVMTLAGPNTYTGGTTISGGTLQLGNGGTTGSIVGDVTNSGSLVFNRSDASTFPGAISGTGSVVQQGSGTTILTANNTYTGGTSISAGTLQLGNGGTTGSIVGDVANNGSLVFDRSDVSTFAGTISGTGAITQQGSGTTILTANNTYSGGTTIQAGMLQIGNGGTTGSITGDVTDNGRLIFDRSDTVTFPGVISGSGSVKQLGGGTTIFTSANTYTGGTVIANGALQLGDGGTSGSITGDVQDGATLIFNRSDTVTFSGLISDWTSTTPDPSGSVQQNGTGTTVLTATNTYSGTTQVNAGTLIVGNTPNSTAALAGGGVVTVASGATFGGYGSTAGDVNNNGTIAVADALPQFQGGSKGSFTIGGTLTNNNLIDLAGTGVGNTLSVHSLVGQGASQVAMNTVLGRDGSPSDLLVINGGNTSGQTVLNIANVGGLGAATTGNGIQVVAANAPATSTSGAFVLGTSLKAGPYQYALFEGARDNTSAYSWYLRSQNPNPPLPPSEITGTVSPPPPVVTPGEPTPPPVEPYVPYYRTEVSLYAALPSMALNYGKALIGTLHDRVGEEEQLRDLSVDGFGASGLWARVVGQDGEWDAKTGGIYRDGPSFDDNMIAVQAGLDLYRAEQTSGARDFAGVLASVGHGHGDVSNYDDTTAGNNRFDSYSVGGYWTHFGTNGWYLDGVLQGTWYDTTSTSNQQENLTTHGFGTAVSAEGGYPFVVGDDWSLEPQSQLIYQSLHLDNAHDAAASVQFRDSDSLAGRIGGRASRTWQWNQKYTPDLLTGWFFANLWHEFKSDAVTAFSSQDGNVPFHSDLGGSWWELGLGTSAVLRKGATLYATVSYDKGFGDGVKALNGSVGMRWNW